MAGKEPFLQRVWAALQTLWYFLTLPIAHRFFRRPPKVPFLSAEQTGSKEAILRIWADAAPYQHEYYQFQRRQGEEPWIDAGQTHELQDTLVAGGLAPQSTYEFRARAVNKAGISEWGGPVEISTPAVAKQGGGACPERGYSWTQTASELVISTEVPKKTRGKDVRVKLEGGLLEVMLVGIPEGERVVLSGQLAGAVRGLGLDASTWEVVKEGPATLVSVTLEKERLTAAAGRLPIFWSSAFQGDPEVDVSELVEMSRKFPMGGPPRGGPPGMPPPGLQQMQGPPMPSVDWQALQKRK